MAGRERRPYGHVRRARAGQGTTPDIYAGRRSRRRRPPRRSLLALLILILLCCLVVAAIFLWYRERSMETVTLTTVDRPASTEPPDPPVPQARVRAVEVLDEELRAISEAYTGTHGVAIFDSYSGESALLNADRRFVAASLSKLYALLTLYRAASRGELSLDDKITMRASDVWAEGTSVLYRHPVGHTMTLRACARLLIKESDNTAEVMLNRYLGEEKIEAELDRIGARSTSYWMPNISTPNDVLLVLKAIGDPSYTSPELSAEMLDVMTGTAFEDRLPRPLPNGARVAHKIGSYESTISDAGIVLSARRGGVGQEYYIVVFSEGATEGDARQAIQEISLAAYQALPAPEAP